MATGYQGYGAGYGDPERAKLDRSRRLAEMLQEGALDTGPKSLWEGVAQLGKAFIARDAMGRADTQETQYADSRKKAADLLIGQLYPDAQGVAQQELSQPAAFDLTPGAMDARQAQSGRGDKVRSLAELLGGDIGGAIEMEQSMQPAGPDYQAITGEGGALDLLDKTTGTLKSVRPGTPKPVVPVKRDQFTDATGQIWYIDPATGEKQKIDGLRARVPESPGSQPSYTYKDVNGRTVAINNANPRDIIDIGPAGSGIPKPTPMQEAVDKNWAGTLVDWASGGSSDFVKQLNELDGVIAKIDEGKELSGPGTGFFPFGVGRNVFGAEGLDAQQTVEGVVQRNLRAVLGAQFTQVEGDRLISRAYDPSLEESVNKRRLLRLKTQMQIAADQKTDAMEYYNQNGTMVGYQGHIPTMEDFEAALDEDDDEGEAPQQRVNWTQSGGGQPQSNGFQWGAPTNRPQTAQVDTPPPGIDPDDWKYMSPEDKAKFR